MSSTSTSENADFAIVAPDSFDGDGNAYTLVWTCTDFPSDPTPPHEVLWEWDLSCCDGDLNAELTLPDFSLPCCTILPAKPPVRLWRGIPVYRPEDFRGRWSK